VQLDRTDELGSLARSLDDMREGIAIREAENVRLAFRDHLTGLANRTQFTSDLQDAIDTAADTGAPIAVVIFNLDRFKVINDTLGYSAGDHVILEVARRVQELLRPGEKVARLGGDEFALMAPGARIEAEALARRVADALKPPIRHLEEDIDVEPSFGISLHPTHGKDVLTLLRNADVALYAAKRVHNGLALYDPAVDISRRQHLSLLGELRTAVEHDDLLLYYQPKLSLNSGSVREVESLLRWKHPQKGMIPPGDFIPFAEQTGYIRVVTRWVLREAFAQCQRWREQGLMLRIAVNLAAADIMDRSLPDYLESLLGGHDVPPGLICLEITEGGFMEDPLYARRALEKLAGLGFKLAIDDYGTGYSSLSYLMKLPVHELKIDRSFVATMATDEDLRTIVRSTIGMGHNLGLKIVAEGVEDAAGLQALKDEGCDQVQGYFVSRPLPAAELEQWLAKGNWNAGQATMTHLKVPDFSER
jgi:diguanylate cyclase (GGDEF)-like protein